MQINEEGLKLHTMYAYPAFASLEKYRNDLPFLAQHIKQISDLKTLISYFKEKCPYLLLYVHLPFSIDDVRHYWVGYGKKTHTNVKFRDWILDDLLLNDYTKERSVKCDINELNRCNVVPAKVLDNSKEPLVEYLVYKYEDKKLKLVQEKSRIKLLFEGHVNIGDIVAKHFEYGVEKLKNAEDKRVELVNAFNEKNRSYLAENLDVGERFIDLLIRKLNQEEE